MRRRDIVDVQLEMFFGRKFPQKVQKLVDDELNLGNWVEGYDLAACPGTIDGDDARKLLQIVLNQHPDLRIDEGKLRAAIEKILPQSVDGGGIDWIVDESGSYALSDSLRVARFHGAEPLWRTGRISWDGIEFDGFEDGKLIGRWLDIPDLRPKSPFVIDFDTGEILKGALFDHG